MTLWHPVLALLVLLALIGLLNAITFPRLRLRKSGAAPFISVIIPARNEAGTIGETLRYLLDQDYPDLEILVLDDQSDDGTLEAANLAARGDQRLRVLSGSALPDGWLGKNWACHQAAQVARGEWLIFTDAEVHWHPGSLDALVVCIKTYRADLLTVWPTQLTKTWSERLVVPMMTFVVLAYLPELAVRYIPWPVFSAANGQCLAFRREMYERIGGHAGIRNSVLDDMSLAWNTKRSGGRLVQALGNGLIETRMYTSWAAVRAGFAKNILAGHGGQVIFLLLSTVFHWALFALPWLWLALGWLIPGLQTAWPWAPMVLSGLGLGIRMLTAYVARHRLLDAFLLPISVFLLTLIAGQSLVWHWSHAANWKGRKIQNAR